jgi:hypothetical protein
MSEPLLLIPTIIIITIIINYNEIKIYDSDSSVHVLCGVVFVQLLLLIIFVNIAPKIRW